MKNVALLKLETKLDNSPSHFTPVTESQKIEKLFANKHTAKYLKSVSFNDKFLNRVSIFAVNYHDGDKFAQFCLI